MAKVKTMTKEERRQWQINQIMDGLIFMGNPTYFFNPGDKVRIGNLKNPRIVQPFEGGKFYEILYDDVDNNYGRPIETKDQTRFFAWYSIRPISNKTTSLIQEEIRMRYFQSGIHDILGKYYCFGLDMNPAYQRGYVWSFEDKQKLIKSIFGHIDIGKFVFVKSPYREGRPDYRILDGKQRVSAIIDFFENKFPYEGYFFNDLSKTEQDFFESYSIVTAEVENPTKEQELEVFIRLNTSGKTMTDEDIKKAKDLYEHL
jgi:hypothetical protein